MNQRFWSITTTTLLTTTLGTSLALSGVNLKVVALNSEKNSGNFQNQPESIPTSMLSDLKGVNKVAHKDQNSFAIVYVHEKDASEVATIQANRVPILTFLNSSDGLTKNYQTLSSQEPKARAKLLAAKLNELNQKQFDGSKITVNWEAESKSYNIKANEEVLVSLNKTTVLPDTTNNLAEDALQATNRLRRLFGNAPPIEEIIGLPKEKTNSNSLSGNGVAIIAQSHGMASWYGPGFHGRRTANGETFNQNSYTAAHRSLPFGTRVRVTNTRNGRSIIVRINDRGPFHGGRVIDLSKAAAKVIGVASSGVAPVRIEVLGR